MKDYTKIRIKRGDNVRVITGKYKGESGKVLLVDRENNRVVVERINMVKKHLKPNQEFPHGTIFSKEAPIHASNVMYLHKGKPTRIGFEVERKEVNGKLVNIKHRVAKSTGERID